MILCEGFRLLLQFFKKVLVFHVTHEVIACVVVVAKQLCGVGACCGPNSSEILVLGILLGIWHVSGVIVRRTSEQM